MKRIIVFLATVVCLSLLSEPLFAQQAPTTDEIIQGLKPRVRTRGSSGPALSSGDAAFIQKMKVKTRGITIEERSHLANIVSVAALPSMDFEITFALNSARLEPQAIQILQQLGVALQSKQLEATSFMVAGHTDARGRRDYNQRLSEERARAVKLFLSENFRMASDRLLAVGYGQEQIKITANPYADENRRVQIINLGRK